MNDFAMQIRIKFKARPGGQFAVRRAAYDRIKRALARAASKVALPGHRCRRRQRLRSDRAAGPGVDATARRRITSCSASSMWPCNCMKNQCVCPWRLGNAACNNDGGVAGSLPHGWSDPEEGLLIESANIRRASNGRQVRRCRHFGTIAMVFTHRIAEYIAEMRSAAHDPARTAAPRAACAWQISAS